MLELIFLTRIAIWVKLSAGTIKFSTADYLREMHNSYFAGVIHYGLLLMTIGLLALLTTHCNQPAKPSANATVDWEDTALVAAGEELFETYCITCHAIKGEGSGPALGGITAVTSPQWVADFITNPQQMVAAGDPRAVEVDRAYPAMMPGFQYMAEGDIHALVAYLHSHKEVRAQGVSLPPGIEDPISAPIPLSEVVVELREVMQLPATSDKRPLARINKMVPNPMNELFVQDLNGVLYRIVDGEASVFLDVREHFEHFVSRPGLATGFGSFAFHPDYASNGLLYTTHTEKGSGQTADFALPDSLRALQWVLVEWRTPVPGETPLKGSNRELMRIDYPGTIHGVQNIAFNSTVRPGDPDYGYLYLGAGDGRAALSGYPTLVEGVGSIWGALLRIDPQGTNSANGRYGIPANNPFSETEGAIREIYAHGFRNPHHFIWRADGGLILTNIGERNLESIYVIERGADYGWPRREGSLMIKFAEENTKVYARPDDDKGYSYPVAEYDHDEGRAICGGYVYTGPIRSLSDKWLFGDIVTGRLFFVPAASLREDGDASIQEWRVMLNGQVGTLREHFGKGRIDLRFGYDAAGQYYLMTKWNGKIYQLVNESPSA